MSHSMKFNQFIFWGNFSNTILFFQRHFVLHDYCLFPKFARDLALFTVSIRLKAMNKNVEFDLLSVVRAYSVEIKYRNILSYSKAFCCFPQSVRHVCQLNKKILNCNTFQRIRLQMIRNIKNSIQIFFISSVGEEFVGKNCSVLTVIWKII